MTVRVLVVDDESDVETLFRQQFRREVRPGVYVLDFALSGKAALETLDGHVGEQIILPVSDINMPDMTRLELLPRVKQRQPNQQHQGVGAPRQAMGGQPVPSQFGQVLARFAVQEAASDHADGKTRVATLGKEVSRFLGESGHSTHEPGVRETTAGREGRHRGKSV
jgi:CheY-like chemotaxis protein